MAIDPKGADLKKFFQADDGKPIVMLHLLRSREDGGRERYAEYARATGPFLAKVGGEMLYFGAGHEALVAEPGQAWDAVLLVRYPSRKAFLSMVADPEYQKVTGIRTSALSEAVLQPTTPFFG